MDFTVEHAPYCASFLLNFGGIFRLHRCNKVNERAFSRGELPLIFVDFWLRDCFVCALFIADWEPIFNWIGESRASIVRVLVIVRWIKGIGQPQGIEKGRGGGRINLGQPRPSFVPSGVLRWGGDLFWDVFHCLEVEEDFRLLGAGGCPFLPQSHSVGCVGTPCFLSIEWPCCCNLSNLSREEVSYFVGDLNEGRIRMNNKRSVCGEGMGSVMRVADWILLVG